MFKVTKKSSKSLARLGTLKTRHGGIRAPFFMPVATQGAVKHITTGEMRILGADILLSNTYHLMLRPGEKLVKKAGGLHKFMDWNGPILTDSGGFQVFSLSGTKKRSGESLVKLSGNGVKFKSYIDGSEHYLTPEKSLKIQADLGVDIAVCLDECVGMPAKRVKVEQAVELTTRWAKKTLAYYSKMVGQKPLIFCVVQGGLDKDLRIKSIKDLKSVGFSAPGGPASGWDGYNIGGLAVGEKTDDMYKVLDYLVPEMPENKPRYLMGVGYPENIVEAVKRGVDMFDCVIPTREGRHGRLFTSPRPAGTPLLNRRGEIEYSTFNITKSVFAKDFGAINENSKLPVLKNLSRAYLHYLFKIREPLGMRLASLNNLEFYLDLMRKIREDIKNNKL